MTTAILWSCCTIAACPQYRHDSKLAPSSPHRMTARASAQCFSLGNRVQRGTGAKRVQKAVDHFGPNL